MDYDPVVDEALRAPLARFHGERPPAPSWFGKVVAMAPERGFVEVEGAKIELLTWGQRGRPGLLFLHGGWAHADWWSFIAPFFAAEFRVAAISMSGFGGSDWRAAYGVGQYALEMIAAAEAASLFEAERPPVFVGHSFGSRPVLAATALVELAGAIILDAAVSPPADPEITPTPARPSQLYPSLDAALARFRLLPPQPCDNAFLLDHIARRSLKPVEADGRTQWSWRFDPFVFERIAPGMRPLADANLRAVSCPLAFVLGEKSRIVRPGNLAYTRSIAPPHTVFSAIPEAGHHLFLDQPLATVSVLRALLASWTA